MEVQAESAGVASRSGAGGNAGRTRRSVGSRLAAEAKAAGAMAVAAGSMEVVMEAKGTAVTVAAKEEAVKEEAVVAEVRPCGNLRRESGRKSATEMRVLSDEPGASCSKRSCRVTCCAEEHHGMSVSMASGRKMLLISVRASGEDGDAGVGEADWESADEGFVVNDDAS